MKVLVIGSTTLDMIVTLDHLPTKEEDINTKDIEFRVGGMAYNVHHMLKLSNVDRIFGCPIGDGRFAKIVESMIDEKPIYKFNNLDNGVCICLVDESGERSFIAHHGAEYRFDEAWYQDIDLNDISYVYISGLEVEELDGDKLVSFIEKINKPIFFAPGPRIKYIDEQRLKRILALKPIVHLNERELSIITNNNNYRDAVLELYSITNAPIIVTLGGKGCYIKTSDYEKMVPGFETEVVDTIGAGDAHAGAVLASLSLGLDLNDACVFANIIGSYVVREVGASISQETYALAVGKYHEINDIMLYQRSR